jgi:hypothetical protein
VAATVAVVAPALGWDLHHLGRRRRGLLFLQQWGGGSTFFGGGGGDSSFFGGFGGGSTTFVGSMGGGSTSGSSGDDLGSFFLGGSDTFGVGSTILISLMILHALQQSLSMFGGVVQEITPKRSSFGRRTISQVEVTSSKGGGRVGGPSSVPTPDLAVASP